MKQYCFNFSIIQQKVAFQWPFNKKFYNVDGHSKWVFLHIHWNEDRVWGVMSIGILNGCSCIFIRMSVGEGIMFIGILKWCSCIFMGMRAGGRCNVHWHNGIFSPMQYLSLDFVSTQFLDFSVIY